MPADSAAGPAGAPAEARVLEARVLDFRPSRHGFHFANRFASGPTVRLGPFDPRRIGVADASAGLCGGMAFTVRDLWERRAPPPPDREPPANGTRRFTALVRRQVHSLDWLRLPVRFWVLGALHPDPPTWWSRLLRRPPLGELVQGIEWPRVRREIDTGRLAQLGLVRAAASDPRRLTANHQVLAYGYRVDPDWVTLRIYDPNWPDRDDVELRLFVPPDAPARLEQSTGEPFRGFFLAPYRPAEPRAWLGTR